MTTADAPAGASILSLAELSLSTQDIEGFSQSALPSIAELVSTPSLFIYVYDDRLLSTHFHTYGIKPEDAPALEAWCKEAAAKPKDDPPKEAPNGMAVVQMCDGNQAVGLIGCAVSPDDPESNRAFCNQVFGLVGRAVGGIAQKEQARRELAQLNSYMTVSSMLAQQQGLHDMLAIALYTCMELVQAEASSVLLLEDDEKKFRFYHAEGETAPVLADMTFPADHGLAGAVLESQAPEVINQVQGDPRFYKGVDSTTGFVTRNMIAIPLTAGEEKIGVLELVNKMEGDFSDGDLMNLMLIAEEIAFAIRNAKVFEYVVESYCMQRQGLATCRGCKRPLGTWTPCVRYRESEI